MQIALRIHRVSSWLLKRRLLPLNKVFDYLNYLLFNCSIPASSKIGDRTKLSKGGIAIIIHERSVIGNDCIIGSCVLIGGRSKIYNVPKIGNRVYIGSGAKVLGDVTIGSDVIIAPNSVVLNDIPSNCIVAGIPATVKRTNIKMSEYV